MNLGREYFAMKREYEQAKELMMEKHKFELEFLEKRYKNILYEIANRKEEN